MSEFLAEGFHAAGHEVHVLTRTSLPSSTKKEPFSYAVTRAPGWLKVWRSVAAADVVFHNNVCMRYAWPLLFLRRPWVVASHTWVRRHDGRRGILDVVKLRLLRLAILISASEALAKDMDQPSTRVSNAYDDQVFAIDAKIPRIPKTLIFVGRLVPGKGVHVLLEALKKLRESGLEPSLTVVGSGQELSALKAMRAEFKLDNQVKFVGALRGADLAEVLNSHEIMVIPSLWSEPFGVVALEGAACGCFLIGTSGGGLAEAIGPCGTVVRNGDAQELAVEIQRALYAIPEGDEFQLRRKRHLDQHRPAAMVQGYLQVLLEAKATHTRYKFPTFLSKRGN